MLGLEPHPTVCLSRAAWEAHRSRCVAQENRRPGNEPGQLVVTYFFFIKMSKICIGNNRQPQTISKKCVSTCRKMELGPYLSPQIQFKVNQSLEM